MLQVLTSAAQRVAQSQVTAAPPGAPQFQSLAIQQRVLTVTAQAIDRVALAGKGEVPGTHTTMSLAAAAQHVVLSAARQVVADHAQVAGGMFPQSAAAAQVTVEEVSNATQTAVAQAVELEGPQSSDVQVLMTAGSLLQAASSRNWCQ